MTDTQTSPEPTAQPVVEPTTEMLQMPDAVLAADATPSSEATEEATPTAKRAPKPDVFPVLEKIAALYPALFGAEFLPLKRGIFQDLMQAHPEQFEKDSLKAAMAMHTRSTRYLTAVAAGADRHDLQGQPVEAMAPEHVYHALIEVFRRRQMRSKEDLRPKLIARMVQALEASGLTPLAYAEQVRNRDEAANAALDEAIAEAQAREAKSEALMRAYTASGKTVEEFADMYGMDPRAVGRMLARSQPQPPSGNA